MLIAQRIQHLLNGVSQRPGVQRLATQLSSAVNSLANFARGLMKRPPLEYIAKLTATTTGWASAFVHSVNRDDTERYRLVIANGTLYVYDAVSGAAETVTDRTGGFGYLAPSTEGFRAVTVGDATIIVNRGKTVARAATKSANQTWEALVTVEQADFSTTYTIILGELEFSFTTVDQNDARSRGQITTEKIAEGLYDKLAAAYTLPWTHTVTRFGSTIHISCAVDFPIKVRDGLGDGGLRLVKGEVQSFEDLPARAQDGMRVKVVGDVQTGRDDYYVEYDASDAGDEIGVWREVVGWGVLTDFDPTTMPHRLVRKGKYIDENHSYTALPRNPSITEDESEFSYGFDEDQDGGAITATDDQIVVDTSTGFRKVLADADGTEKTVIATFDVDTSLVEYGISTIVKLIKRTSIGGETTLASRVFRPGESYLTQYLKGTDTFAATDRAKLVLEYGTGVAPPTDRQASLTVLGYGGTGRSYVPLRLVSRNGIQLTFPDQTYPQGSKVKVTLDTSNVFTYTVGSTDEAAATVAEGVKALITADAGYTAVRTGLIVTITGATVPQVDGLETYYEVTEFYASDLSLTDSELIGLTVENLSDGSSGTITANTEVTLTATLTGGTDNAFQPGDRIRVIGTATYFIFEECPWDSRASGDDETNPFPSFTGEEISEVFFYQNRLGFTSGEKVVLSKSGDLFDLFRASAIDLNDDDPIDVQSAHAEVSIFHSATAWNSGLYLWSENGQFLLSGDPVLTPRTVRLDLVSRYFNSSAVRPVVLGKRLFFAHQQSGSTRIFEYKPPTEREPRPTIFEITQEVPTYLSGSPEDMAGDDGLGVLAVKTSGLAGGVYVFSFADGGDDYAHAAWQKWTFSLPTEIVQIDAQDGKLVFITLNTDGIYLAEANLDQSVTPGASEQGQYLDFRQTLAGTDNGADTDYTLPYTLATDGSEGTLVVVRTDTYEAFTPTRPTGTTAKVVGTNLQGVTTWVGILYEMRVRLSPIYKRDRDGLPETQGRFQLRYLDVHYHDTSYFTLEVTPEGRSAYTYTVAKASPRDGTLRASIATRAETVQIELVQGTEGGARISGLDIEGYLKTRTRRG